MKYYSLRKPWLSFFAFVVPALAVIQMPHCLGDDANIPQLMRAIISDPTIGDSDRALRVLSLVHEALEQEPTYGADYETGEIIKATSLPYIVGILSSPRDNPAFLAWKERLPKVRETMPIGTPRSIIAISEAMMGLPVDPNELVPLLRFQRDDNIPIMAIEMLEKQKDKRIVPALQELLRQPSKPSVKFKEQRPIYGYPVRDAAAKALANLGASVPTHVEKPSETEAIEYLSSLLHSQSIVSVLAATNLGRIGTPAARKVLAEFIKANSTNYAAAEAQSQMDRLNKKIGN